MEQVVPVGTRVDSCISLNHHTTSCQLTITTNNDAVIKVAGWLTGCVVLETVMRECWWWW